MAAYLKSETKQDVSKEKILDFFNRLKITERWMSFNKEGKMDINDEKEIRDEQDKNTADEIKNDADDIKSDGVKDIKDENKLNDDNVPEKKNEEAVAKENEKEDDCILPDFEGFNSGEIDNKTTDFPTEEKDDDSSDKSIVNKTIPNAQCNNAYSLALNEITGGDMMISSDVADIVKGLNISEDNKFIKGVPQISDDYIFKVETALHIYNVSLFVNKDPKTLWVDNPSDELIKPDKDYFEITTPNLKMIAASYRGRMHALKGTYRDDHFLIEVYEDWAISVVADGAGSAKLSSTGSMIICDKTSSFIKENIKILNSEFFDFLVKAYDNKTDESLHKKIISKLYDLLPAAVFYARKSLEEHAIANDNELKLYHTTALVTISKKINNYYFTAAFQIGDGISVVFDNDELIVMGEADHGEFVGQTLFVTSGSAFNSSQVISKRIKYHISALPPLIFSMSDGITDSYFNTEKDIYDEKRWGEFINELKAEDGSFKPATEILEWLNYYVPQEHDDRTLVIIQHY